MFMMLVCCCGCVEKC